MMTRPDPTTIRLGSQEWTIRPLTLGQLERLEPVVQQGAPMSIVAYGLAVVRIGLERDHPEAAKGLADVEATTDDLAAATREVLRLGGYVREPMPGEAGAAETAAASTSGGSTDASPPAAATPQASSPT